MVIDMACGISRPFSNSDQVGLFYFRSIAFEEDINSFYLSTDIG